MADGYDEDQDYSYRPSRSSRPSTKRPPLLTKVRPSKVDVKKRVANKTQGNNKGLLGWGNPLDDEDNGYDQDEKEQEEAWERWQQWTAIAAEYNDDDGDDDDARTCERPRACICCVRA